MPNSLKKFDIAVIGNWHLAYVTSACLAKLGLKTVLVGTEERGSEIEEAPVYEPGLPELMQAGRKSGCLEFRSGINGDWSAERVWLAIDTPVDEEDRVDLSPLRAAIAQLKKNGNCRTGVLIISSQIPLGFCEWVEKEMGLTAVYIPENLRLGQGIDTFLKADRTVIGATDPEIAKSVKEMLRGTETDFLLCDLPTAEMIKHATNAFLATSISFSNELARVGERYGVDSQIVGKALKMDKRIGKGAYVAPGLGFAGGTLPRDLRVLQTLGATAGVPTPLMDAVLTVNESTTEMVVSMISDPFAGNLSGKSVLILGYTYKADTNTLRRSLSVSLAADLLNKGASVWGFDPFMNNEDLSEFAKGFMHFSEWDKLPKCPDVVVLMTPRSEFKALNWGVLRDKGGSFKPFIIDLRSGLQAPEVLKQGFSYKSIWQPFVKSTEEVQR